MTIGRTVPSERNNTFSPDEVRRKTFSELYSTSFNKDQKKVLDTLIAGADESASIATLIDAIEDLEERVEALENIPSAAGVSF